MTQTATIDVKSKRGGSRIGAGRKPNSISKKAQAIAKVTNKMIAEDVVPLRTMLKNMQHYDDEARTLTDTLAEKLSECKDQFTPEDLLEALRLVSKIGDARMSAQKCAVDAAPYVHPKLSAISMDVKNTVTVTDIEDDADTMQFADEFRKLRSQPFLIEQEDVDVE